MQVPGESFASLADMNEAAIDLPLGGPKQRWSDRPAPELAADGPNVVTSSEFKVSRRRSRDERQAHGVPYHQLLIGSASED